MNEIWSRSRKAPKLVKFPTIPLYWMLNRKGSRRNMTDGMNNHVPRTS